MCVCEVLKRGGESNSGYLVQLGCPLLCSSLLLFFFFSFFTPLPHLSHLASSSSNAYNFHIFSTFPHNGKRHLTQLQQTLISCGKCIHNFLCNTHACNILQGTQRGSVRERERNRERERCGIWYFLARSALRAHSICFYFHVPPESRQ